MKRASFFLIVPFLLFPLTGLIAQQAGEAPAGTARPTEAEEQFRLATSSDQYPVTPGDVYTLTYQQGNSTISSALLVGGDCMINLGVFGNMDASGMAFSQLKQVVQDRISTGYPRSMPSVTITSLGIFNVHVRGETPVARYITAWGFTRVSDVIKDVLSPSASLRNIEVISKSGESRRCDLFSALRSGNESENPFVRPGDTIVLYRSERSVEIAGEVFRPGTYELLPREQINELVNLYGDGLTSRADPSRSRIQRMSGDTPTVEYANIALPSTLSLSVGNGDIVTIPAKTANLPAVIFEGAILPLGTATGATGAGSAGAGTAAAGAAVTNAGGGTREETAMAQSQYNRMLHPFTEGETLSDALRAVSGSLAPYADLAAAFLVREGQADPIYIDMRGLVTSSASPSDLPLKANDRIVVPPFSSYVSVQGAVFAPGSFPFRAGLPVWYYLGLAGGVDPERNSKGQFKVMDAQGKSRSPDEPIKAGDFIFIPNNDFFYNFNRFAPIVTVIATIIGTTLTTLGFFLSLQ
jgi:polysaccharide biosynthesis/export protein